MPAERLRCAQRTYTGAAMDAQVANSPMPIAPDAARAAAISRRNRARIVAATLGLLTALAPIAGNAEGAWNASLGATSNYVYRGISQTYGGAALQLGANYQNAFGWFAGAWGSNVDPYPGGRVVPGTRSIRRSRSPAGSGLHGARDVHALFLPARSAPRELRPQRNIGGRRLLGPDRGKRVLSAGQHVLFPARVRPKAIGARLRGQRPMALGQGLCGHGRGGLLRSAAIYSGSATGPGISVCRTLTDA